jgi:hypothetical protein
MPEADVRRLVPAYSTRDLYLWPVVRQTRYVAVFVAVVVFVPSALLFVAIVLHYAAPALAIAQSGFSPTLAAALASLAIIGDVLAASMVASSVPDTSTEFRIDEDGVAFVYPNGREWRLTWRSPGFRLKLLSIPKSEYPAPHSRVQARFRPPNRIPIEATELVVETARRHGLSVKTGGGSPYRRGLRLP